MASRGRVLDLFGTVAAAAGRCPAHSQGFVTPGAGASSIFGGGGHVTCSRHGNGGRILPVRRGTAIARDQTEYAFEMACSNIRYGAGVTAEVGFDCVNLGAKKVLMMTDPVLAKLPPVAKTIDALTKAKVDFETYEITAVEPTDVSFRAAIEFARSKPFDAFVAVGGGSVIDTCKAANLYASDPEADFLDYVNAPLGKGKPVTVKVHPLIAIPTTAGTGSETTGVAIFDYTPLKAKTGIASRAIRPLLGIVDPEHVQTLPERVAAWSGFDVLCHALESFTAVPYQERTPRPANPINRPAYQGSNPISDIWSSHALRMIKSFFVRGVFDVDDVEARSQMHLASAYAGVGFGNAGCHLPHGISYAISGNVKPHISAEGYDVGKPLIPHGLSVVITAPAVFQFTGNACPDRHLEAASNLGYDISNSKRDDAGKILSDVVREYMFKLKVPNGLSSLGYGTEDIPALVEGTLPQKRVTGLAPRPQTEEDLAAILENSLNVY